MTGAVENGEDMMQVRGGEWWRHNVPLAAAAAAACGCGGGLWPRRRREGCA